MNTINSGADQRTEGSSSANGWAAKQVWPSIESITLRCDRPLAGSMGFHWWYNDHEAMEEAFEAGKELDYVPIVCKSCGLQLKLSVNAPEYPAI